MNFTPEAIGPGKVINPDTDQFKEMFNTIAKVLPKEAPNPDNSDENQWLGLFSAMKPALDVYLMPAGLNDYRMEPEDPVMAMKPENPPASYGELKVVDGIKMIEDHYTISLGKNWENVKKGVKVTEGLFLWTNYFSKPEFAQKEVTDAYDNYVRWDERSQVVSTVAENEAVQKGKIAALVALESAMKKQVDLSIKNYQEWLKSHSLPKGSNLKSMTLETSYDVGRMIKTQEQDLARYGFWGGRKPEIIFNALKNSGRTLAFRNFEELNKASNPGEFAKIQLVVTDYLATQGFSAKGDFKGNAVRILNVFNAAIYRRNLQEFEDKKSSWFLPKNAEGQLLA